MLGPECRAERQNGMRASARGSPRIDAAQRSGRGRARVGCEPRAMQCRGRTPHARRPLVVLSLRRGWPRMRAAISSTESEGTASEDHFLMHSAPLPGAGVPAFIRRCRGAHRARSPPPCRAAGSAAHLERLADALECDIAVPVALRRDERTGLRGLHVDAAARGTSPLITVPLSSSLAVPWRSAAPLQAGPGSQAMPVPLQQLMTGAAPRSSERGTRTCKGEPARRVAQTGPARRPQVRAAGPRRR